MTTYTASNGAIVADLTTLRSIPSTDLPASGFVVLFVAAENSWFEYSPTLTSGDATPANNPASGRWLRIGRDKLTANRTYFVRTDGSDSNTGLVNNSGGAFLTIQKAIDVVASLDISIYDAIIQIADGTHTGGIVLKAPLGRGKVIIRGNTTTPSNVILTHTSDLITSNGYQGSIQLTGIKLTSSTNTIYLTGNGNFEWGLVDFGTCGGVHLAFENNVIAKAIDNYSISGTASIHLYSLGGAFLSLTAVNGKSCTITGNPTFSIFAYSARGGIIQAGSSYLSYSGSANGKRYEVLTNAIIEAFSSTFFPGNSAGTTDGFGVYQ